MIVRNDPASNVMAKNRTSSSNDTKSVLSEASSNSSDTHTRSIDSSDPVSSSETAENSYSSSNRNTTSVVSDRSLARYTHTNTARVYLSERPPNPLSDRSIAEASTKSNVANSAEKAVSYSSTLRNIVSRDNHNTPMAYVSKSSVEDPSVAVEAAIGSRADKAHIESWSPMDRTHNNSKAAAVVLR